jgi:hypothetical protein
MTNSMRRQIQEYIDKGAYSIMSNMREGDTYESYLEYRWSMISIVRVNFEGPEVTVITKDAKATFSDKLGNIGMCQ